MAIMNVNPTRMELFSLKEKLVSSRRGHRILKDKQDELMRQFLLIIKETEELREEVDKALKKSSRAMSLAKDIMSDEELEVALMMPTQKIELDASLKTLMNVSVPQFNIKLKSDNRADAYSYGFAFTSEYLDESLKSLSDILPRLINLAEYEKTCHILSSEIERTRRRVNALEHVIIPDYEDTIRYISLKLQETERSTTARLMKVKDMMLKDTYNY